ncbi:MAG: beta/gamma crystallin-related protein [Pseudomonadota bacterium]
MVRALFLAAGLAILSACASLPLIGAAGAQQTPEVVLYDGQGYSGPPQFIRGARENLGRLDFNNRASSIRIRSGAWELCTENDFGGRCAMVSEDVADLASLGLNNRLSSLRPAVEARANLDAPLVLYDDENFRGDALGVSEPVGSLKSLDFNDRAESVEVRSGVWLLCEHADLKGRCEYIDRSVRDLDDLDLEGDLTSIAFIGEDNGPDAYPLVLFSGEDFRGRFVGVTETTPNLKSLDFDNTARSLTVNEGQWLVCAKREFGGLCEVVSRGFPSLEFLKLDEKISSIQAYDGRRLNAGAPRGGQRGPAYGGPRALGQVSAYFPAPQAGGLPIDACLGIEGRCGAAADLFCREAGFARAGFAAVRENTAKTVNLDGDVVCDDVTCPAMTDVLCTK